MKTTFFYFLFLIIGIKSFTQTNTFFIGNKTYPCSKSYSLCLNYNLNAIATSLLIAKDGDNGLLALTSNGKIHGTLLLYLDDNTIITCYDKYLYDQVNLIWTTVYNLTKVEIAKLKTTNVNSIRFNQQVSMNLSYAFSVDNTECVSNILKNPKLSEKRTPKIDFPTIIKDLFSFNTAVQETSTIIDIDGNIYKTVKIGNQIWMAENLKTTKYRDGSPIPNVTDSSQWIKLTTGAFCNYNNDVNNAKIYGRLYNWYAVGNSRNIAPKGWHVATDEEWATLITYLGGESEACIKLMEVDTTHWKMYLSAGFANINSSGFSALPSGGYVEVGGDMYFDFLTFRMSQDAIWWSSTDIDKSTAWYIHLGNFLPIKKTSGDKLYGFSVRCVKD